MTLGLDETIQRILISTTSRFFGAYEGEDVAVDHAWPSMNDQSGALRWEPSPISRSTYMLSFRTEPLVKKPGVVIPNYEYVGDVVAAAMAVLFGKRTDNLGAVEMTGRFVMPRTGDMPWVSHPELAFNSHAVRANFPIPLNLVELRRLRPILEENELDEDHAAAIRAFHGAARFYQRALQAAERDPEVGYLHLITCGEILSNAQVIEPDTLLDDAARALLGRIETEMAEGRKASAFVRGRLRQIKRRYLATFERLIDASFFERGEAKEAYEELRVGDFARAMSAAYDLRSRFVHTGVAFGHWIAPRRGNAARQVGKPVVEDKEMSAILERAPTFAGLERITRYALLRFGETIGIDLEILPPAE